MPVARLPVPVALLVLFYHRAIVVAASLLLLCSSVAASCLPCVQLPFFRPLRACRVYVSSLPSQVASIHESDGTVRISTPSTGTMTPSTCVVAFEKFELTTVVVNRLPWGTLSRCLLRGHYPFLSSSLPVSLHTHPPFLFSFVPFPSPMLPLSLLQMQYWMSHKRVNICPTL